MTKKLTYEELEQRVKELEQEVAKRGKVEKALQESEEFSFSLLNNSPNPILVINPDTSIRYVNSALEETTGFSSAELIGRKAPYPWWTEETLHKTRKDFEESIHEGARRVEEVFQRKNGERLYVEITSSPVKKNAEFQYYLTNWVETTERRRAEKALRTSQEYARNIIDSSLDMIIAVDTDRNIVEFNKAAEETFGYRREEAVGTSVDILYADPQEGLAVYKKTVEQGQCVQEIFNRRKNGKVFPSLLSASLLRDAHGEVAGVMGLSRDITERIEAEEALRKKTDDLEERVKELNCLYGMSNLVEKADISLEDILQGTVDLIPPSWQYPEITCARAIVEGQELKTDNFRDTIWKQTNDIIVYGESVGVLEVCCLEERLESDEGPFLKEERDLVNAIAERLGKIIEHKQAEEALKESEEKYRALFEASPDGILIADNETRRFKYASPALCKMLGYSEEELRQMGVDDIHPKDELEYVISEFEAHARGEKTLAEDIPCLKKDDTIVYVDINGTTTLIDGRKCDVGFFRDITEKKKAEKEKKKLEAQFQAAQRMEAMGTLAGGIAHNFNNILMGIQGNTSLVLLNKTSAHPDYERLKGIEEGVKSGAELTRQLLGFARGGKYEVRPTNLNEVIKSQNHMFGRTKKEITVCGKYEESLWTVEVDQGQIGQVLLNLYVNAWQAMPAGGDLYIQTENVTLDENYTRPFSIEPGRYVKISVTDTGVGMDKKTRDRIFDPFFTTQEMGRGTGLGLASVYGIVRNHGGIINVASNKGKGAIFTIYLPASEKEVIEDKEEVGEALKGTETVLLVDDEDMIIDVGEGILTELGYKVLLARSGKETIEIYKKSKEKIDMVILDMIMPGVGGGKAYDRMKKINPDIKVLLSSGYSINGQATEILERGCNGFIQKPFNMRELSQEVRKILDT